MEGLCGGRSFDRKGRAGIDTHSRLILEAPRETMLMSPNHAPAVSFGEISTPSALISGDRTTAAGMAT
jgi:hypothetical protein